MKDDNWKKFPALFSLYIAQSVPMSFFSTVIPVIMRQENFSLQAIGMIQLVRVPWILKLFWAPVVDNSSRSSRDLKKWIFFSELFYAAVIVSIAFFNLQTDFTLIIVLMVIATTASATQDIATDSFAIHLLKKEERELGNTIQAGASFIGALISAGVLIFAFSFFGWSVFLFILAAFTIFALGPVLFFKKKFTIHEEGTKLSYRELFSFLQNREIRRRLPLLLLMFSGFMGIMTMLKPYLVDLGYNLTEIAFMSGIIGTSSAALSTVIAGLLMKFLGRKGGTAAIAFYAILTALYFWYISGTDPTDFQAYLGVGLVWAAYGSATMAIYTSSMDVTRKGAAGTDFTFQIVITHVGSMIVAVLSGRFADRFGYDSLFIAEAVLGILTLVVILLTMKGGKAIKPQSQH